MFQVSASFSSIPTDKNMPATVEFSVLSGLVSIFLKKLSYVENEHNFQLLPWNKAILKQLRSSEQRKKVTQNKYTCQLWVFFCLTFKEKVTKQAAGALARRAEKPRGGRSLQSSASLPNPCVAGGVSWLAALWLCSQFHNCQRCWDWRAEQSVKVVEGNTSIDISAFICAGIFCLRGEK